MLNCLQVKNIVAATPEELQEELNKVLQDIGKRVQEIQFMHALTCDFACSVIYWSQNVPAEMTAKVEGLPDDPEAKDGEPIFVCVIHDYQRSLVKDALLFAEIDWRNKSHDPDKNAKEQDACGWLASKYAALQSRFENDNEQPEEVEIKGYNVP